MSAIFWSLLFLTVVFGGSFAYRVSKATRQYNLDRDQRATTIYAEEEHNADTNFDFFLVRWALIFAVLTIIVGLIEGLFKLLT